jgi:hypothetical protein
MAEPPPTAGPAAVAAVDAATRAAIDARAILFFISTLLDRY